MQKITNQVFQNETILFDGFKFVDCTFQSCIVLIGSDDCEYENCTFIDTTIHVESFRALEEACPVT